MEIFKDVKNYEGYYQISNLGRIKSLETKTSFGVSYKIHKESIVKSWKDKKGYCYVSLSVKGIKKNYLVHRLVAISFIENPLNKPQVNHINGIKSDNNVNNLEWCTAKENLKHAVDNGLNLNYGIHNYNSKLSLEEVYFIRISNLNQRELALKFNMSQSSISKIILKKTYKKC